MPELISFAGLTSKYHYYLCVFCQTATNKQKKLRALFLWTFRNRINFITAWIGFMSIQKSFGIILRKVSSEKNSTIKKYDSLKKVSTSALQSQGLLQLKSEYCDKNGCLKCAIGNTLLNK